MTGNIYITKDMLWHEPVEATPAPSCLSPRPITIAQIEKAFEMVEDDNLRIRILEYLDSLVREDSPA